MGEENFLTEEQMNLAAIGLHLAQVQHLRRCTELGKVSLSDSARELYVFQLMGRNPASMELLC